MFKALLRLQMMEIRRMYFRGKRGSKGLKVLFIFLYIMMLGAFFALAALFGHSLLNTEYSWIYFMIMSVMAFVIGVFGSVMTTAATLFQAKDNEFLLAMPIPPSKILLSRMFSVYAMSFLYEALVMIPTVLYYFFFGRPSVISAIFCILAVFILGFLVLVFSCLFGWIVALLSSKLKNKSFITVIISVILIALFIWFRIRANVLFKELAEHAQEIGDSMRGWGYPIYALGLGMSGNVIAFLVFTAGTAVLFFLTCLILSKSFLRIVSVKDEGIKAKFSDSQIRTRTVSSALRKKEFRRFTSSPNYMINCGFGALILLIGAVLAVIYAGPIRTLSEAISSQVFIGRGAIPVAAVFAICLVLSMCDIAAPSISLEGANVWIMQTLPVDPYQVFKAKIFVHVSVAGVPALLCIGALIFVLRPDVFTAICMVLCVLLYLLFSAAAMLALDLKRPMLDWTNETQPIKQSLNVLFSLLGGMLLSLILAGLYLLVGMVAGSAVYLLFCSVLFAVLTLLLRRWLCKRGRILFANL